MDKAWLKNASRKSGVTTADLAEAIGRDRAVVSRIMNGHQQLTLEQAKIFGLVLGVSVDEVLVRAGLIDAPTAQAFTPGFAESDAAPFDRSGSTDRTTPSIAEALGAKPGVDIWQIKSSSMALMGYMSGDYMLVDTGQSERVRPGDVVIAQVYDNARGAAVTLLRRFEPPVLVAASVSADDQRVYVVDGNNVVIRGKVVASWRVH